MYIFLQLPTTLALKIPRNVIKVQKPLRDYGIMGEGSDGEYVTSKRTKRYYRPGKSVQKP